MVCAVASAVAFVGTLSSRKLEQLDVKDNLADAKIALRRLRYLSVVLSTGTWTWEQIAEEYEDIVKRHEVFWSPT